MRIFVIIWIVIWVNFIARDLYKHGKFEEYITLSKGTTQEKYAYVYGEKFYELLKFAKNNIPENASFKFSGMNELSIQGRRGVYYMYPALKKENPEYIIVYEKPGFKEDGFRIFQKLDNGRFILKKD